MTVTHLPRAVERTIYGVTRRDVIDPNQYLCALLVAELADAWVHLAPEIPGSAGTVRHAIRTFGTYVTESFDTQEASALTLQTLRRHHLDGWERDLLGRQRAHRTDTAYRLAVHLFALLRRIDDDHPDVLDPVVAERVRRQTRLNHVRRDGLIEFPLWERRRLIAAAKRCVEAELARLERNPRNGPGRDSLVAILILLCLGTGEPTEVLRALRLQDITAVQADSTDHRSPEELCSIGGPDTYLVRFTKRRAGIIYDDTFTRAQRLPHWALTAMFRLTRHARADVATDAERDLMWLWRLERGRNKGTIKQAPWAPDWSMAKWVRQHIGPIEEANPASPISEPIVFARLRKTLVARDAVEDPARYLRTDRRHSAETFFRHYAQSPVLRARAGKVLIDAINEMFDHAISGPVVITPDAEALLAEGVTAPLLEDVEVPALLGGQLDGPLAACRNPLDSPHASAGAVCSSYANGQCFSCRNAIITRRHLPAVMRLIEVLNPDRFGRIDAWRGLWEPTYRFLTEVVVPQFDHDDIERARSRASHVYLDAGLLQTLGDVDAAP